MTESRKRNRHEWTGVQTAALAKSWQLRREGIEAGAFDDIFAARHELTARQVRRKRTAMGLHAKLAPAEKTRASISIDADVWAAARARAELEGVPMSERTRMLIEDWLRTPAMKRTSIKRKKRINPVNRERKAKAFDRNFGARGAAVREMECLATPALRRWLEDGKPKLDHGDLLACDGDIQAAHLTGARGKGGCNGDGRMGIGPMCRAHHDEAGEVRGTKRTTFERRYSVCLADIATGIALDLTAEGLP